MRIVTLEDSWLQQGVHYLTEHAMICSAAAFVKWLQAISWNRHVHVILS